MTLTGQTGAVTHYVSPGQSIQAAIKDANNGDEIEVAPGTYNEAINFNGKAVRLYSSGGPYGTTIDANGAYHVVQCVSGEGANTILEGFTITGGNANGSTETDQSGGGMYNYSSSPMVINCKFILNGAVNGGGMYIYYSSPTVTNCTFSDNNAAAHGGGMFIYYYSSPTVTNCTFIVNQASGWGGGMFNLYNNDPTVTNCTFNENSAGIFGGGMCNCWYANAQVTNCTFSQNTAYEYDGGGVYNYYYSNPTVTNCTFSDNTASTSGGGMVNDSASSPKVTNCTFSDNTASSSGGGMDNRILSSPKVTNCIFSGNTASSSGGGMDNDNSSPTVTNCTFIGNKVNSYGGGVLNDSDSNTSFVNCIFTGNVSGAYGGGIHNYRSSPTLTNCTFSKNSGTFNGGGMTNYDSCRPVVTNCILWGNKPDQICDWTGTNCSTTVAYCDVEGGWWSGTGNIDKDPCFVNPDANDYHLKPDSPCIDAGDTTSVSSGVFVDADSNPRGVDDPAIPDTGIAVVGLTVDMGAYEFQLCRIAGDINCDGMVDFKDLAILCNNWLATH
jgi:parallel beta-helix repeat protein